MASPQQQQHAQGPGAGGDGDPWDPQQRTLRADPYHHQQPQQPPSAAEYTTSYGGAGVFQATSPPAAGQGRMPAPIRSGRASPTSDQPRPVGPRPSSSGNGAAVDHHHHLPGGGGSSSQGRSHVQIQQQLPNPRAGRAHNPQSLSNASAPFETTFAYPPNYPAGANAFATAGKDSTSVADSERQPAHQQASGSAFSRKRPNAQTYKSNSSAEWARLLGRAGYAAAPQQDDGTQDPNWPGQSQLIRGPGTKASPTNFLCLPITTEAVRKFIMILTIAAILWVPGIVALTAYNAGPHNNYSRPRVWKVGIFWWSVWLSSIWVGWFVAEAVANLVPRLLGGTVGAFSMEIKHYLQYLKVLAKFIALFAWTILLWISWLAVIWDNFQDPARNSTPTTASTNSTASGLSGLDPNALFNSTTILGDSSLTSTYNLMLTLTHLWFGLIICAGLLLAEKFLIQVIALSFHRVSYEDRLAQNKLHVEILTTLYDHALRSGVVSSAASSRPGTPTKGFYSSVKTDGSKSLGGITKGRRSLFDYERPHLMRRANRSKSDESGINNSIMGYVASELGTENDLAARDFRLRFKNGVPLPTKASPRTAVIVALSSANETRKLSYRIFRTFSHWEPVEEGTDEVERVMVFSDISRFFSTAAAARVAWELLDKDYNGSVTEEEMLAAGQEVHRERDALMSSMRDIDSAVGRLDQVFMSFFSIISVVIVAGLISIKFSSLVTSFGTVLLGLSWLLSATAQEALSAIIFLFVKHPYDVGDRVEVDGGGGVATYVVAEIQLLSTIFKTTTGKYVQISHSVLTTKMVTNLRRSGPIEETITFDVPYSTTFEQIEQLRERMMEWIAQQPRDFFPGLNIAIIDLPEFKSMTLQCPIRYKSNWQAGGIKTMRKNRWMCRFKEILSETGIALPDAPSTTRVTMIPYPPPESETAKPSAAEALASTRGGSGEAREYNFLDDADAHDAKVLNTRIVRQRADEGYTSGAGLAASRPGSAGLQQQLQQAGGEMRRRPLNGDEAA
ncbi:hypothetical protein OC844_004615 [Tilletia horrida]|nr:hypothetical protein OC844_004615 [Tilletia horrida]